MKTKIVNYVSAVILVITLMASIAIVKEMLSRGTFTEVNPSALVATVAVGGLFFFVAQSVKNFPLFMGYGLLYVAVVFILSFGYTAVLAAMAAKSIVCVSYTVLGIFVGSILSAGGVIFIKTARNEKRKQTVSF